MILRIVFSVTLLVGAGTGYIAYDRTVSNRCTEWLTNAGSFNNQGYYSQTIEQLTLYFSTDRCRTVSDANAIKLLSEARIHVPLPQNAHLSQQLALANLGWKLKRDDQYHLIGASAALVRGSWAEARKSARQSKGTRAALIALTASIRLADLDSAKDDLEWFVLSDASHFQWSLLQQLLFQEPELQILVGSQAPKIDKNIQALAALSAGADAPLVATSTVNNLKTALSDDDLSTATSLLIAQGHQQIAKALLDQPERQLSAPLLTRHARLLWGQKDLKTLSTFHGRSHQETMPGEVHMIVCLADLEINQNCTNRFDSEDYQRRYGAYAASRWGKLLSELSRSPIKSSLVLDALSSMKDLVAASPVAQQLAGIHYNLIGETVLAEYYFSRALAFGLEIPLNQADTIVDTDLAKESCAATNTKCISHRLSNNIEDFQLWRRALSSGFKPDAKMLKLLRGASPKEATLWRLAQAHAATNAGTDQSMAESLQLIRPVLKWTPDAAMPNLLASAGTAHFSDNDATYGHLATAAKSDPNSAVAALRLALHYYNNGSISPSELVHWWTSITRLEMKARGAKASDIRIKGLLLERLAILALEGEQRKDKTLAMATYETILEISPNHHIALNNVAVILSEESVDLYRAERMALKAVTLQPNEPEYRRTLKDVQGAIRLLSN